MKGDLFEMGSLLNIAHITTSSNKAQDCLHTIFAGPNVLIKLLKEQAAM